jgi:hypothetical protein
MGYFIGAFNLEAAETCSAANTQLANQNGAQNATNFPRLFEAIVIPVLNHGDTESTEKKRKNENLINANPH